MAYDTSKDKELWKGAVGNLRISVHAYNGGEAKLQIGPRIVETKEGAEKFMKAGRITEDEFDYLIGYAEEILAALTGTPPKPVVKKKTRKSK